MRREIVCQILVPSSLLSFWHVNTSVTFCKTCKNITEKMISKAKSDATFRDRVITQSVAKVMLTDVAVIHLQADISRLAFDGTNLRNVAILSGYLS